MNPRPVSMTAMRPARAFTLVELLFSMVIISILMMSMVTITTQTSNVWRDTTVKANQFREARDAFESITRNLSQATLNIYYDYYDNSTPPKTRKQYTVPADFIPAIYGRQSELRFLTGASSELLATSAGENPAKAVFFHAPLGYADNATHDGLENLINTWGYYVQFRSDTDRPTFMPGATRYRYRLMEFMEPTEKLKIYSEADIYADKTKWLQNAATGEHSHVLASNIVALVFLPKLPSKGPNGDPTVDPDGNRLAPIYDYDSTTLGEAARGPEYNSKHQLPPVVEVTMVAIDEGSAARMESGSQPPALGLEKLFQNAAPAQRKADMEALQKTLSEKGVKYRVFSTEVSLRGAKWSREQTK